MASPADIQKQAIEDVERIAREFYHYAEVVRFGYAAKAWVELPEQVQEGHRAVVRALLRQDVIRVGRRPETGPEPMANQLEIVHTPTILGGGRYRQQTAKEGR